MYEICTDCVYQGKHRDLQRITVPYSRLLGITEEVGDKDDPMVT